MKKVSLFMTSLLLTASLTIYTQNSLGEGYLIETEKSWLVKQQQYFKIIAQRALQSVLSKITDCTDAACRVSAPDY